MIFLPTSKKEQDKSRQVISKFLEENKLQLFHVRDVPVKSSILSVEMKKSEPAIKQFFVKIKGKSNSSILEKKLFIASKQISNEVTRLSENNKVFNNFYISSFSNKIITYKGMLLSNLVRKYFLDLRNKSIR